MIVGFASSGMGGVVAPSEGGGEGGSATDGAIFPEIESSNPINSASFFTSVSSFNADILFLKAFNSAVPAVWPPASVSTLSILFAAVLNALILDALSIKAW
ncbi:hypothetical protein A3J44_06250 [candidate division WOR-1 bacterium RIFCSPHIGHO2_02_FULL_45_12]|nr:MAG: hypothetical protein A3J44_06250 [candidate division WOR-1 bacterium RIFCSPHIGHO2_02_FULL_45_12]